MRGIVSKQESPYIPNLVNNLTSPSSLSSGIIRGYLQSENYIQGSSGWKIDRSGVIQALQINIAGASTVAGWSIDGNRIFKTNAVLHSDGYVAFGSTPPTGYGNNVGAFLGIDGGVAKMSLYKDSNNYLQWNGEKLFIRAENFLVGSDGKLQSSPSGDRWVLDNSPHLQFFTGSTERMRLSRDRLQFWTSSGVNAGVLYGAIGSASLPVFFLDGKLDINDNVNISGDLYLSGSISSGNIFPAGNNTRDLGGVGAGWASVSSYSYVTLSDKRLKKDFKTIEQRFNQSALSIISKIPVSTFRFKNAQGAQANKVMIGFIADEIEKVEASLVNKPQDDMRDKLTKLQNKTKLSPREALEKKGIEDNYKNINQNNLFSILFQAVKELYEDYKSFKTSTNNRLNRLEGNTIKEVENNYNTTR